MQCTYFSRDGYCAKGQYCPFLHTEGAVRAVCKKYLTATGCRFGSSCAFVHGERSSTASSNTGIKTSQSKRESASDETTTSTYPGDPSLKSEVRIDTTAASTAAAAVLEAEKEKEITRKVGWEYLSKEDSLKQSNPKSNTSDWNFDTYGDSDSSSNTDGIYFYGASGTTTFDEVKMKKESAWDVKSREIQAAAALSSPSSSGLSSSYQDQNGTVANGATLNYFNSEKICPHFISGDCRYGSNCRYYHDIGDGINANNGDMNNPVGVNGENDNVKDSEKDNVEDNEDIVECSICISTPDLSKGELFGLMSHCNCVFCLICIRGWRNEGTKDTFKSEQVRICPNCRVNSYFVVPSLRLVSGQKKEDLIVRYKQSLSSTVCKHYKESGQCPFGSSCFYQHINQDGTIDNGGPSLLFNSTGMTEVKKETTLSDFIRVKK